MTDGSQSAQVQCDNCGWVDHLRERCFDFYPELRVVMVEVVVEQLREVVVVEVVGVVEVHQRLGHLL